MTDFEKDWIDKATYKQLFAKVRFAPIGDVWMTGDTGQYLLERWGKMREELPEGEHTRISKELGW